MNLVPNADKGEGVQNHENFADVIYGRPLCSFHNTTDTFGAITLIGRSESEGGIGGTREMVVASYPCSFMCTKRIRVPPSMSRPFPSALSPSPSAAQMCYEFGKPLKGTNEKGQ